METTSINGHGKRCGRKEKRGRWARRPVPLAATLLVALPVGAAHGGTRVASGADGAIVLRYQFTPGERFAYAVTEHSRAEVADPQAGLQTSARVGHFILRYVIQSVSPDGTAAARTSASSSTVVLTLNGQSKTYHGVNPPDVEYLGADNSLPGFVRDKHSISSLVGRTGVYGVQLFGALPASPLTPGTTFSTSADQDLTTLTPVLQGAKLPAARVVAHNTFVGYHQDGGVRVAVIDSRATPSYSANGTIPALLAGQTFHVTGKGTLHIVSTYDVAHKRLRAGCAPRLWFPPDLERSWQGTDPEGSPRGRLPAWSGGVRNSPADLLRSVPPMTIDGQAVSHNRGARPCAPARLTPT